MTPHTYRFVVSLLPEGGVASLGTARQEAV